MRFKDLNRMVDHALSPYLLRGKLLYCLATLVILLVFWW